MLVNLNICKSSKLSGDFDAMAPFGHLQGSTALPSVPAKDKEEEAIEDEVPCGGALLLTEGKCSLNIVTNMDYDQQPLDASISKHQENKKKRWYRKKKLLETDDHICSGFCYCAVKRIMHVTKSALIPLSVTGWRTASNMLWILVSLQMFSTVISGHPSCEHIVNITQANPLTIRTSDLKQHCDLNSIPFCPEMIECFKDKLKICSMSNFTKKMSYSPQGIGKYYLEYGTDEGKEVDLTEKGCKKTNNSVEDATPNPESSSTNSNLRFVVLLIPLAAVGLFIWYKNKERCRQSVKESAKLCSGSSRSTRPDASASEETSTNAPNMELHAFIVQAEET